MHFKFPLEDTEGTVIPILEEPFPSSSPCLPHADLIVWKPLLSVREERGSGETVLPLGTQETRIPEVTGSWPLLWKCARGIH